METVYNLGGKDPNQMTLEWYSLMMFLKKKNVAIKYCIFITQNPKISLYHII